MKQYLKRMVLFLSLIGMANFENIKAQQLEQMWYNLIPPRMGGIQDELGVAGIEARNGFIYVASVNYEVIGNTSPTTQDYFVAKLNAATGDTMWTNVYNATTDPASRDVPTRMRVDDLGNVYVTGYSVQPFPGLNDTRILTIKYDSNGVTQWIRRTDFDVSSNDFHPPGGLEIDNTGNIYVGVGQTKSALIKYDSNGNVLWVRKFYDSTPSGRNIYNITLDSENNIILTGMSLSKFTSDGDSLWKVNLPNPVCGSFATRMYDVITDAQDNIYVTGARRYCDTWVDIFTMKFNEDGNDLWAVPFHSPIDYEGGRSILLDNDSNLYIGGFGGILKYNNAGGLEWVSDQLVPTFDKPQVCANIFLLDGILYGVGAEGEWRGDPGDLDLGTTNLNIYKTVKLNINDGSLIDSLSFTASTDSITPYHASIRGVRLPRLTVDNNGNVYVSGEFQHFISGPNPQPDTSGLLFLKYSPSNVPTVPDLLTAKALTDKKIKLSFRDNSIIETGFKIERSTDNGKNWAELITYPPFTGHFPFIVIYTDTSTDGETQYCYRVKAINNNWESSYTNTSCAFTFPSAPSNLLAIANYGPDYEVTLNWDDHSNIEEGFKLERKLGIGSQYQQIAILDSNITTYIDDELPLPIPGATYYYRIRAYDNNGHSEYSNVASVLLAVPVELTSFTANAADESVIVNWITATEINNSGFEVERSQRSNVKSQTEWEKVGFVEGKGTTTKESYYSFSDDFKNQSFKGTIGYRLKQIDFDGMYEYSNEIEVEVDFMPKEYTLFQNYPNPFNPVTVISWQLPVSSYVTLKVYNVIGQEIAKLVDGNLKAEINRIEFKAINLNSGIYFYTIEANGVDGSKYAYTKKMILIK